MGRIGIINLIFSADFNSVSVTSVTIYQKCMKIDGSEAVEEGYNVDN